MTYSLGNGISFSDPATKELLGGDIDTRVRDAGYNALIGGEAFLFLNRDRVEVFKISEFVPLIDELNGTIRAGIRFWQIDAEKPMVAVLYTEDGYTRYEKDSGGEFAEKSSGKYIETKTTTRADEMAGIAPDISYDNYGGKLPIVPLWGSRLHQSTLVGMRNKIDSFDMIQSGFCDNLEDCAEAYFLISGAGAATEEDMQKFRDKLKLQHIASVPNSGDVSVQGYTQEIPYQARKELLDNLRQSIYEDFGGMDVHTVAAGATNDHIDAAYQPLDENADDFEYQIIQAVQALLALKGVPADKATPLFKRNRISNQKETTEMVIMAAPYLDDDTIRAKLPFLTVDEVAEINKRAAADAIPKITENDADDTDETGEDDAE